MNALRPIQSLGFAFVLSLVLILGSIPIRSLKSQEQGPPQPEKILGHWGEDTIGFRWTEQDSVDGRWQQTDIGPFLATSIPINGRPIAKGRVIALGESGDCVCYDTETGLCEGWWRGPSLVAFSPARYGLIEHPRVSGQLLWSRVPVEGERLAKYQHRTMLQRDRQVVLQGWYGQVLVQEHPTVVKLPDSSDTLLRRVVRIEPHAEPLVWNPSLSFDSLVDAKIVEGVYLATRNQPESSGALMIRARALGEGAEPIDIKTLVDSTEAGAWTFPPTVHPLEVEIVLSASADTSVEEVFAACAELPNIDWEELSAPSEPLWNELIETHGVQGPSRVGMRMDTIELPFENPYKALMFLSGIDFIDPTTAMICTVHGDVWKVSGLDQNLEHVQWKRFATGLFQPLGLKIVDGRTYVLGRDQLTQVIDRNLDGEADEYRCINNQAPTSLGTHDYAACLEVDAEGRFISARGNTGVERFAADGSSYEVIATGLRNPNGLGVSPSGMITVAPQEGEWTPASNIAVVHEGAHFGYRGPQVNDNRPLGYDPPMIWLPRLLDNSCGGQAWLSDQGWDGLNGAMIHLSFGRCWPLLVLPQKTQTLWQAAAVRLPFECDSGISRARTQPESNALYIAGLKGWASSSAMDGCLHRLVRTDDPLLLPIGLETISNGIVLHFDVELDEAIVQDRGRWSASQWNYQYSAEYGSADYRPSKPAQPGHDELPIRSVTLLSDRRSVFVEVPTIGPVMQLALSYDVQSASGDRMKETLYQTIHALSDRRETPGAHASEIQESIDVAQTAPDLVLKFKQTAISGELVTDYRVARRVALSRQMEPLTPWIEARSFEATFEGWWFAPQREIVSIVLEGNGSIEVLLRGEVVPVASQSENRIEFAPIVLDKGLNELQIHWAALEESPERFELLAAGEDGLFRPIAAERLRHDPNDSRLAFADQQRQSRIDFAIHQCHRCHALPSEVLASAAKMPELDFEAPDLRGLNGQRRSEWLVQWILDPKHHDPNSQMPRMLRAEDGDSSQVAADLAAFLLSLEMPKGQSIEQDSTSSASLSDEALVEEGWALAETIGCVACHVPKEREGDSRRTWERVGHRFTEQGLIEYLRNPAAREPHSQMPTFALNDQELQALAAYLMSLSSQPEPNAEFVGDVNRGREAFETFGCVACHSSTVGRERAAGTIAIQSFESGCLASTSVESNDEAKAVPDFGWDEARVQQMRRFLEQDIESLVHESRIEVSERWMQRLNCNACHGRDGALGDLATILFEESEQGLSPEWLPDLSWADEKFDHGWAETFVAGHDRAVLRPWLRARMPAFPGYARGITQGWRPDEDQVAAEREAWYQTDQEMVEVGARLISPIAFDCRQCHAMGDQGATGDQRSQIALGINFVEAGRRLRPRYFHQWMSDPLAIDPQTKMPVYSEDGKTTKITTELGGDAESQFNAILQYLRSAAREPSASPPPPQ